MDEFDVLHLISLSPTFFLSFLGAKQVAALDNAFVNGDVGKRFLSCLRGSVLIQVICTGRSIDWILRRKVLPEVICLDIFMTEMSESRAILLSEFTSAVKEISTSELELPANHLARRGRIQRFLLQFCPQLQRVDMNMCAASDLDIRNIATSCRALTELSIHSPTFQIANFKTILRECRHISVLDISNCEALIRGSGLDCLVELCPQLTTLHLNYTDTIGDRIFYAIATRLPSLAHLHISEIMRTNHADGIGLFTTPVGFIDFAQNCPPLQSLQLTEIQIPEADFLALLHRCPSLQQLQLSRFHCMGATDGWFGRAIAFIPQLKTLELTIFAYITPSAIQSIAEHCPQLRAVTLQQRGELDCPALTLLVTNCTALRRLDVRNLTHEPLMVVHALAHNCTNLEHLHLCTSIVTQECLNELAMLCPNLTSFVLMSFNGSLDFTAVAPLLRNLQYLDTDLHHLSDASVLSLVAHCTQLRSLRFMPRNAQCKDVRIVDAMERNCPHMYMFHVCRYCSKNVYYALVRLQARREQQKFEFYFIASLVPACCGFSLL